MKNRKNSFLPVLIIAIVLFVTTCGSVFALMKTKTPVIENTIENPHKLIPYNETGEITVKKIWKDRQSEYPTRRKLVSTGTQNEYDVIRSEGAVSEAGDPLNAENLNDLENRIENGFTDVNKSLGTS